jgi:hypothetical protein
MADDLPERSVCAHSTSKRVAGSANESRNESGRIMRAPWTGGSQASFEPLPVDAAVARGGRA